MSNQEVGAFIIADLTNLASHIMHPLKHVNNTSCSCLLCLNNNQDNTKTNKKSCAVVYRQRLQSLLPMVTASDLDLIKTGSFATRQLIFLSNLSSNNDNEVVNNDVEMLKNQSKFKIALRLFCSDLKVHLNYDIDFKLPCIDPNKPYHILVLVLQNAKDTFSFAIQKWFHEVRTRYSSRVVLVCDDKDFVFPIFQEIIDLHNDEYNIPKITVLGCKKEKNLEHMLKVITHAMLVHKHRLMPKDLGSYFKPDMEFSVLTTQPDVCLFL